MKTYICEDCGYIYDEEAGDTTIGIAPGTMWDELDEEFVCPFCGVNKESFTEA